jgi:stress-induced morphogen
MAKQQISIRISERGKAKLDALAERFGNQTTAIEIALDRLYQQETEMEHQFSEQDIEDALFAAQIATTMQIEINSRKENGQPMLANHALLLNALHDNLDYDEPGYDYAIEVERFRRGKEICRRAELISSERYRVGTMPAKLGHIDSPEIEVPAGHIATNPAVRRYGLRARRE